MVDLKRLVRGSALTVAALGFIGCASTPSNTGANDNQGAVVAGPSSGAVTPAPTVAGPNMVSNPTVGSVPPVTTLGAAGARAGTAGAPSVAGPGAGGTGAPTGTAGTAPSPSTDTWTAQSNLDANGLLIAPAAGQGFQIQTTMFDLAPGQEVFNCYHVAVPNDADFPVGEWDGQMTAGSHHFILYRDDMDTTPSGTLVNQGCTSGFGGSTWLYTQGTPRSHLMMPDGVAMVLTTHERIIFDMHYINTGSTTIHARITLNINKETAAQYQKADSQVSFNLGIAIPPNGMQTVGGDCTPVPGASYFIMQTHTHKRGILSTVTRTLANGQPGEEFVRTTNWDMPQAHEWHAAPFLTFQSGELFHYSCTYMNDRATTVTVGTSADANEMCMAEAYFFPAVANVPACN